MANLRRGQRGSAGRSRTLGPADPRDRRAAQAARLETYQVAGPLEFDGRGRLRLKPGRRPADLALPPLSADVDALDGTQTAVQEAIAINGLAQRVRDLEGIVAQLNAANRELVARLAEAQVLA